MEKITELNKLIEELQGSDGVIDSLKAVIDKFEKRNISDYNNNELDNYIKLFQDKSNEISFYYESFIAAFIEANNEDERKTIELYIDYCLVFINKIQNKYINTVSHRINNINNQKSLKKANTSIIWGIISVAIGVIATVISLYFSVKPDENAKLITDEIQSHTTILKNLQNVVIDLDSLIKEGNKTMPAYENGVGLIKQPAPKHN
jgi:hypothetical protein